MTIRTPDDEITSPGWFYPPFREGWTYEGQTYGGHTDYSVDWNRREIRPNGQVVVIQDKGDPVLAQQDGTVAEVDKANGAVFINHFGGTYRTESRHMDPVLVKVGQKVQRGDLIGRIGAVGISPSSGFVPSPHLHVVHWKKVKGAWQRIQQSYEGNPVRVSVGDSDSRPRSWDPPAKVYLQGPPPKATWESAQKATKKALDKAEDRAAALTVQLGAKAEEARLATKAANELRTALTAANESVRTLQTRVDGYVTERAALQVRIKELEAMPSPDCVVAVNAERGRVLDLLSDGIDELVASIR